MQDDIVKNLQLKNPLRLVSTFDRPNLHWSVLVRDTTKNMQAWLQPAIASLRQGESALFYANMKKDVESLANTIAKMRPGHRSDTHLTPI